MAVSPVFVSQVVLTFACNHRALVSRDESIGIGPCRQTFGRVVSARLVQIESSEQCGAQYDNCVARRDGWCKSNIYNGVGAVQTEAGRLHHESQLCQTSPEYQQLYMCVSNSGFSTAEKGQWILTHGLRTASTISRSLLYSIARSYFPVAC